MASLYANRTLLGNIALVVFLAFLVTLTFGMVPAQADTPSVEVQDKAGAWQEGTAGLVTSDGNKQVSDMKIRVYPLTDTEFSNVWFQIKNQNAEIVQHRVYVNTLVYEGVYEGGEQGYSFIYDWIYGTPLDVDHNYTLEVWLGNSVLASVYLDLEVPPPSGGGGGGGGGGVAPSPGGETTTDTGTIESKDGEATLTVDPDKVDDMIADKNVATVEFTIPADVAETAGEVAVPADTLAAVFEADKPVAVQVGETELLIPPGALDLDAFTGQDVTLQISITKSDAPAPGSTSYKVAGEIFNIEIRAIGADGQDKGGIHSFDKPVELTLAYDPAKLGSASEDYLGLYRYNETTKGWDYVGGEVDKADNTVTVERNSLSTYAIMAYDRQFADMVGHWANSDVKLLAAKHIAGGIDSANFGPAQNITRAEFAGFLVRALNLTEQKATGTRFSDVNASAWYAGVVETAAANGLVSGSSNGTFMPNAPITRQEMACMVTRALAKSGVNVALSPEQVTVALAPFNDTAKISAWAKTAVAQAVHAGIIGGRSAGECAPMATATRAEAAAMVKRMITY